jgi:hypothetical protein
MRRISAISRFFVGAPTADGATAATESLAARIRLTDHEVVSQFDCSGCSSGPSDYFSSSRSENFSLSIRSTCSASATQPAATFSNALFMNGSLACAARSLASAALSRYLSARGDIQGERQTNEAVPPDAPNQAASRCIVQLVTTPPASGKPRPAESSDGPGRSPVPVRGPYVKASVREAAYGMSDAVA